MTKSSCSCCSCGKVFLGGFLFAVIAQIVHSAGAMLTMGYYMEPAYFPVWSKVMMPAEGPPPVSFMIYGFLFSLIAGLIVAAVYPIFKKGIACPSNLKKGLFYGLILFLLITVPGSLSLYLLINLPLALIISWAMEQLIIYILSGIIIAKLL